MKDITRYIPYGRRSAISKTELCRLSGWHERTIRDQIKKANVRLASEGFAILSSSRSPGYWMTDDSEEIMCYLHESERRANQIYIHNYPLYSLAIRLMKQKFYAERSLPVTLSQNNETDHKSTYDCENCTYRNSSELFCGVCMCKILDEWTQERKAVKENFFHYVPYEKNIYVFDTRSVTAGVPKRIALITPYRKVLYFIYPIPPDIREELTEYAETREPYFHGIPFFKLPPKRARWEF